MIRDGGDLKTCRWRAARHLQAAAGLGHEKGRCAHREKLRWERQAQEPKTERQGRGADREPLSEAWHGPSKLCGLWFPPTEQNPKRPQLKYWFTITLSLIPSISESKAVYLSPVAYPFCLPLGPCAFLSFRTHTPWRQGQSNSSSCSRTCGQHCDSTASAW